ncbi:hypothetical protein BKA81DRAFT_359940 [Phyllosticta paracitricarpa]
MYLLLSQLPHLTMPTARSPSTSAHTAHVKHADPPTRPSTFQCPPHRLSFLHSPHVDSSKTSFVSLGKPPDQPRPNKHPVSTS